MKKVFWILTLIILISSCETEDEHFTISGEVTNANGEKLYLIELQSNNIVFLDSVILNNEGVFSFKGQTDIPKFYALRTNPNNYLTIIVNPNEQITVKTKGNNLAESPVIEGSPESKKIAELRKRLDQSVNKLDSLGAYYQSLIGTRDLARVRDSLSEVSQNIIKSHVNYTKSFIEENNNSLSSLMALYQQIAPRKYVLNLKDDFEYFALVDSSLMQKYPESDAVKSLHAQIEEIKRQQKAESEINSVVGIGVMAPEIYLPNPSGDTIALSSLRGKYVLLDFWASWCRPCRVENPNLVKSYKKYSEKGFEIYQVSLDKKKEAWVNAIESDNLDWAHVSDLKYWNSSAAQLYKVQAIPASFLLDKNGKIIAKNLRGDALEAKLSELFD
ncbi:MAG: alkyl hydroperoxide reductase [Marinilabiliales bacterium]|nr:MAG: alkyl hydroperoxide reductase [Marinilabiliales bacterium]